MSGTNGNGRTREQMSEDMKRYWKRKRHIHSWVWDGIGGRCACGADITNEEAAMSVAAGMGDPNEEATFYRELWEVSAAGRAFKPDAFIADRLAMQAEIERLMAENGALLVKLNDALAAKTVANVKNARLKADISDWEAGVEARDFVITRLTASLATARADALEEAAKIAERLTDSRDAPYFKGGNEALNCAAQNIRHLKAQPIATDSPTGASAEKTTPGSPAPQTASSAPPNGWTGVTSFPPYRDF